MTLIKAIFGEFDGQNLTFDDGEKPFQMRHSFGTGQSLVSHEGFGADLIRFEAGKGVQNHTHPGDHILFTLKGSGYVVYEGEPHKLSPGVCYFVKGSADHAIKAETDLLLIAVGNEHHPVDSDKRMTPVPYRQETASDFQV